MADYLKEHQIDGVLCQLRAELNQQRPEDPILWLQERIAQFKTTPATGRTSPTTAPSEARYPPDLQHKALSIVVFGASGDLAKKKTYPALYKLYLAGLLPTHATIFGYARRKIDDFKGQIMKYLKVGSNAKKEEFWKMCEYVTGKYDSVDDVKKLGEEMAKHETRRGGPASNRLFYLALPSFMFAAAGESIKSALLDCDGWSRVVVEKPFGRDLDSSNELAQQLGKLFTEEQTYRIDHYLGKEMVQNLCVFRFANKVLSSVWSNECISNVVITFKEDIGTEGRGGYFDSYGIIRDIIQNHLLQIMSLVAMEKPKSLQAEHIRDEKVHVLQNTSVLTLDNTVLGQYVANDNQPGYTDDPSVPNESVTPTYAMVVLYVNTDRWQGVPFILKAGKALNERKAEVRVQFKNEILPYKDEAARNELVMRVQPDEAIYLKMMAKVPGLSTAITETELDLSYSHRYYDVSLPDAYEGLLYEVLRGNQSNFVRTDELEAAWKIFTPVLHQIEDPNNRKAINVHKYKFGSRGPEEADALAKQKGFVRDEDYSWTKAGKL